MNHAAVAASPGSVRRIVILRALFLGDLLISTPAWRALRRCFPQAEISLIGLPWAGDFVPHVPELIDRLLPFPGYPGIAEVPYDPARSADFLAEQRAYGYDLAIQMHDDGNASNGFVADLGARFSLGCALPADQRLDLRLAYCADRHEVQRWLDLVALLGASTTTTAYSFALSPAQSPGLRAHLRTIAGRGPLVGLHVGAYDPARRWPPTRFAALAQEIHRLSGAGFVLTGSAAERPLTERVRAHLDAPLCDLSGQTSLAELAAVIAELDLLISNDTGVAHLAAALGTPSVIVFGPTLPAQFAPPDRILHQLIDAREYCLPSHTPAEALAQLPIEPVLAAALSQLSQRLMRVGGWREREVA